MGEPPAPASFVLVAAELRLDAELEDAPPRLVLDAPRLLPDPPGVPPELDPQPTRPRRQTARSPIPHRRSVCKVASLDEVSHRTQRAHPKTPASAVIGSFDRDIAWSGRRSGAPQLPGA
jgi:hypothetical protein